MLASSQTGQLNARTEVYRSLGTLRAAETLFAMGVETATEQMYLLVRFVVEILGRLSDVDRSRIPNPERWVVDHLNKNLNSWRYIPSQLNDWHRLFTNSKTVLDWDPYREFANLLEMRCSENVFRRAATDASRHPNGPTIGFIVAAAEEFRERRLPAAVHGFDPIRGKGHEEAWFAAVFRWFLLRRATADRSVREQLKLFVPIESAPLQPDEILERLEDQRVAQNLHAGLHALEAKHVDALRAYFGLGGSREHALHEIAARRGVSHHTARWLVIDALTALSVRLGVQGVLSEEETDFAQLVFGKGMPTRLAARQLKVTEGIIRRNIQKKFHGALRKRTHLRAEHTGEAHSAGTNKHDRAKGPLRQSKVPDMNASNIVAALRLLTKEPEIFNEGSQKSVRLAGGAAPLTTIRSLLAEDEELCDELVEAGVPLEWVFTHDGERVDIFRGEDAFSDEIEKIASREWSVAETVRDACISRLHDQELPQLAARFEADEAVARIVETLEGLSVALLRTIDARLRQTCPPFRIWQREDTIYGRWEGGPPQFELPPFVLRQVMRFGEFRHDTGIIVASTIGTLLAVGELPLPGFDRERPSSGYQILRPQPAALR